MPMKQFLLEFKKIDNSIIQLVKSGIKFSFYITIIASIVLLTYDYIFSLPIVYYIGLGLFKASLYFIAFFIICGLAFHKIKFDLGK